MTRRFIGGFHALNFPTDDLLTMDVRACSVLSAWSAGSHQHLFRQNARSGLAVLIKALGFNRLWLPTFICDTLLPLGDLIQIEFYPMEVGLSPNLEFLYDNVGSNDAVLFVDYFGISCRAKVSEIISGRSDVCFIEDASMALSPGSAIGDWRIFSPRKLVGVPNGGIAFCHNDRWSLPESVEIEPPSDPINVASNLSPLVGRLEDPNANSTWYPLYRESEAGQCIDVNIGISKITLSILSQLSFESMASKTTSNQKHLKGLINGTVSTPLDQMGETLFDLYPLLGLPVLVDNPDATGRLMAAEGIFCPRHWKDLPAQAQSCEVSRDLSRRLLTLPCDYRYSIDDMQRVAESLKKALKVPNG